MTKVIIGTVIGVILGAVIGIALSWSRQYLINYIAINTYGPERLGGPAFGAVIGAIAGSTKAIVDAIERTRQKPTS